MSKFKVGDNAVITSRRNNGAKGIITKIANDDPYGYDNSYYVDIYGGERRAYVYERDLRLAERLERDISVESLYNYQNDSHNDDYDYLTEMATIARDQEEGILISVNPERQTLNIPYFKVYDNSSVNTAKCVARLHFKDSGMEYHKDSLGKRQWIINNGDVKNIRNILQKKSKRDKSYTYWQMACFQWNYENGLIDDDTDKYFAGKYDEKYRGDSRLESAYVPSTQEMPDIWIYDPSKGKK